MTRVMGVIAEKFADDRGLVWPESVAPARVHLVQIGDTSDQTDMLYKKLRQFDIETIWDDRDMRPGEKFADADLMGLPHRVVISPKTVEAGKLEYKSRVESDSRMIDEAELTNLLGASK